MFSGDCETLIDTVSDWTKGDNSDFKVVKMIDIMQYILICNTGITFSLKFEDLEQIKQLDVLSDLQERSSKCANCCVHFGGEKQRARKIDRKG